MPRGSNGVITYWDYFNANGINAGFDINQSGYGEQVEALQTVRAVPWATNGYSVVAQVAGLQPYRRTYQATVYGEQDYGALRALVGAMGTLTTRREGSPGPMQAQLAILTGLRRGNFQYPWWPFGGDGITDLQTIVIDFTMLQ